MFDLGIQELIVIFVVALIVFGPKKLPELGRTIGKGMAELRRAMEGVRTQIHTEFDETRKPEETARAESAEKIETGNIPQTPAAEEKPQEEDGRGDKR